MFDGNAFLVRQASEQYFTSSQFAAHFFRQAIGRPQTRQGLLGRNCLFPLKGRREVSIVKYAGRYRRTLDEQWPVLASIDADVLARERAYATSNGEAAFAAFRAGRAQTVALIAGLQWLLGKIEASRLPQ